MLVIRRHPCEPEPSTQAVSLVLAIACVLVPVLLLIQSTGRRIDLPSPQEPMRLIDIALPEPPEPLVLPKPEPTSQNVAAAPETARPLPLPESTSGTAFETAPEVPLAPVQSATAPAASAGSARAGTIGIGRGNGGGGGGAAPRPDRPQAPTQLYPASWYVEPTLADIERFYPRLAHRLRIGGGAVLACQVLASHRVRNCRVLEEFPGGYDFGKAVLAASRGFRVNPPKKDGVILEDAWVAIRITFTDWGR